MTLLDKLNSDLKIAEAEYNTLSQLFQKENNFLIEILLTTTKAKIESINKQIIDVYKNSFEQQREKYIDRRDGTYTC